MPKENLVSPIPEHVPFIGEQTATVQPLLEEFKESHKNKRKRKNETEVQEILEYALSQAHNYKTYNDLFNHVKTRFADIKLNTFKDWLQLSQFETIATNIKIALGKISALNSNPSAKEFTQIFNTAITHAPSVETLPELTEKLSSIYQKSDCTTFMDFLNENQIAKMSILNKLRKPFTAQQNHNNSTEDIIDLNVPTVVLKKRGKRSNAEKQAILEKAEKLAKKGLTLKDLFNLMPPEDNLVFTTFKAWLNKKQFQEVSTRIKKILGIINEEPENSEDEVESLANQGILKKQPKRSNEEIQAILEKAEKLAKKGQTLKDLFNLMPPEDNLVLATFKAWLNKKQFQEVSTRIKKILGLIKKPENSEATSPYKKAKRIMELAKKWSGTLDVNQPHDFNEYASQQMQTPVQSSLPQQNFLSPITIPDDTAQIDLYDFTPLPIDVAELLTSSLPQDLTINSTPLLNSTTWNSLNFFNLPPIAKKINELLSSLTSHDFSVEGFQQLQNQTLNLLRGEYTSPQEAVKEVKKHLRDFLLRLTSTELNQFNENIKAVEPQNLNQEHINFIKLFKSAYSEIPQDQHGYKQSY